VHPLYLRCANSRLHLLACLTPRKLSPPNPELREINLLELTLGSECDCGLLHRIVGRYRLGFQYQFRKDRYQIGINRLSLRRKNTCTFRRERRPVEAVVPKSPRASSLASTRAESAAPPPAALMMSCRCRLSQLPSPARMLMPISILWSSLARPKVSTPCRAMKLPLTSSADHSAQPWNMPEVVDHAPLRVKGAARSRDEFGFSQLAIALGTSDSLGQQPN